MMIIERKPWKFPNLRVGHNKKTGKMEELSGIMYLCVNLMYIV
jgi:hypothetical protein